MNPRISFLPSYSVLALQKVVEPGLQLPTMCAAVCAELNKVAKSVNMPLSSVQNIYGMDMLYSDWEKKKNAFVILEGCIVLPWGELDLKKFSVLDNEADRGMPYYLKSSPAGLYAIVPYEGCYEDLEDIYDEMFGKWLPSSNYRYAGGPVLEIFRNDHLIAKKDKKVMDVCFPVLSTEKQVFSDVVGVNIVNV